MKFENHPNFNYRRDVSAGGHFAPKRDDQRTPQFIQRFSSATQEHYHYEDGHKS